MVVYSKEDLIRLAEMRYQHGSIKSIEPWYEVTQIIIGNTGLSTITPVGNSGKVKVIMDNSSIYANSPSYSSGTNPSDLSWRCVTMSGGAWITFNNPILTFANAENPSLGFSFGVGGDYPESMFNNDDVYNILFSKGFTDISVDITDIEATYYWTITFTYLNESGDPEWSNSDAGNTWVSSEMNCTGNPLEFYGHERYLENVVFFGELHINNEKLATNPSFAIYDFHNDKDGKPSAMFDESNFYSRNFYAFKGFLTTIFFNNIEAANPDTGKMYYVNFCGWMITFNA